MNKKFRVGDKVKVVGMSLVTFAPGVKDELGTESYSKPCSERSTPFEDSTSMGTWSFDRSGQMLFGSSRNF